MAVGVVVIENGEELFVNLCDTEKQMRSITVKELKEKILDKLQLQNPDWNVRVVETLFKGKPLEGDATLLSDQGIQPVFCRGTHYPLSKLSGQAPFCPDQKHRRLEDAANFEHRFELPDQRN